MNSIHASGHEDMSLWFKRYIISSNETASIMMGRETQGQEEKGNQSLVLSALTSSLPSEGGNTQKLQAPKIVSKRDKKARG